MARAELECRTFSPKKAYFLIPESLHQTDCFLYRQRKGEMRSRVNLRHLDVLVAEVPLPLCVPADLVLSEDVRDQISCKVEMVQTQRFDLQRKKQTKTNSE